MKICSKCGIEKDEKDFYRGNRCDDCISKCNKEYYAKNLEKKSKYNKEYYAKNLEKKSKYNKEYRTKNLEKIRAHDVQRNKDPKRIDRCKKWRKESPESAILASAKYRAKRTGIPFNIDKSDIVIPTHCPILGIKLQSNNRFSRDSSPSLDRVVPNLGYIKGNIITISWRANRVKSNATVEELGKLYNYYKAYEEAL